MVSRMPLVVILGATGSGKTKLSLELAKKFGGEIIGADSMQVYKCLDIITAKATKQEQSLAPHHMIDILEPHENYTVLEYRNRVLEIIQNLHSKNKLPIVVGGTNYYIESLLWRILVDSEHVYSDDKKVVASWDILPKNDYELPSEELHEKLKLLDPAMARRLHPNNKRKILRSLEVLHQQGKRHSEIINEQQTSKGGSRTGGGLRYDNSVILWLQCEQEVLDNRLNARVDSMIEQGLLNELLQFNRVYNENRNSSEVLPNYKKGIFQSIGFKEFHSYLMLPEEDRNSEDGKKKLDEGIEQLKMVTRRYARKQKRWIVNRFLGRSDREVPPVYALDTTDVTLWTQKVSAPAMDIVQSFVSRIACKHEPLPVQCATSSVPNSEDDTYGCQVCERVFVGEHQWQLHLASNRHKRRLQSKKKSELLT